MPRDGRLLTIHSLQRQPMRMDMPRHVSSCGPKQHNLPPPAQARPIRRHMERAWHHSQHGYVAGHTGYTRTRLQFRDNGRTANRSLLLAVLVSRVLN